jgi:tetratricopeptide (TPR) repeat protein/outer membrane lipoprotein-sorting protein
VKFLLAGLSLGVFLLAGLLLGGAPLRFAQSSASEAGDPAAILNQAASAYREASNIELRGTKIREQHDDFVDNVVRTPFILVLTPENKFRQESKNEAGTDLQVGDGQKHWDYSARTNKYAVNAGTPNPLSLFNSEVDLRFTTSNLLEAKFLRQESLEAGGAQHFCDVIQAHYDRYQARNTDVGDVLFWIEEGSHIVWKTRLAIVTGVGDFGGKITTFETTLYSGVKMNQDLAASTFTFTTPPGATEQNAGKTDAREALLGRPAPDFKLRDLGGDELQLSALKGKVVLLDFWATWCVPCRMAMPKLNSLFKQLNKQDVVVMGIDVNEDEKTVRDFIRKNKYEYPILVPGRGSPVIGNYEAHALPTMVLIDKNGVVADYKVGYGSDTEEVLRSNLVRVTRSDYLAPKPAASPAESATSASAENWPEPKTADDFLHRGYENRRERNYARAIQDASAALALQSGWPPALRLRADAAYDAKDYQSAVKDYTAVLQQHPDWAQVYDQRGLAYSYSGRHGLAIPDYTLAIKLDPYLSGPYNNRGWAYLETGDVQHAIQDLNHAIELAPEYLKAYENRAKAFDKQNDLKSELVDLEDIVRMAPENQWAKDQREAVVRRLGSNAADPPKVAPAEQPGATQKP